MKTIATPWPDRALIIREAADSPSAVYFSSKELATASAFKLARRREEWLLSRVAAKELALQLGLAGDPQRITVDRPFVLLDGARTDWYVSISHSAPYAAAAIAREPVGIDVQVVREIAEWSSHLFLTADETEQMRRCAAAHRVLHFWCAKEAAWKQKSDEYATMKQAPLQVVGERASGIVFDCVETVAIDDFIVAMTL